ncbi:MAG: hypothetical protein RLZZ292_3862, partial [Bacteroidota bacterium]
MKHFFLIPFFLLQTVFLFAQTNTNKVFYAGGSGRETFYDVVRLSDASFLVAGYAEDLDWIAATVPKIELPTNGIHNALGGGKIGFLLHLSQDLKDVLNIVYLPKNTVENIRFIKTSNPTNETTDALFISGTTQDTRANEGGYFLGKLNNNFVKGTPTDFEWVKNTWAEGYVQANQPWDVGSNQKVIYVTGQSHAYDWAQVARLNADGTPDIVEQWRTHWTQSGKEYKGLVSDYPNANTDPIVRSGIVLKKTGRCDLRSWTQTDYDLLQKDENGGTKQGKYPLDAFFNSPCDISAVSTKGPGYTGYSTSSNATYGAQSLVIDRRDNAFYLGMNVQSILPDGNPDFEPLIVAMQNDGTMRWWSRLYHEIQPDGTKVNSSPDQYIDGLAIDYSSNRLVVNARCHGNNVENLWKGNVIAATPTANGFQNQFTGSSGNIHISWLGKLELESGTLAHSTYVAEYAEGATGLGKPHPDPNLDHWSNPNDGWAELNTTRLAVNATKVTADGAVCVLGVGRRTITTKNAYQKMVKPTFGGKSSWNSFVRVYASDFSVPKYSSLVVGQWDTLTQTGGDNTQLFGVWKTPQGIVAVGRHTADANNIAKGNALPVINVPTWASNAPQGESAVLVYYSAQNLYNPLDSVQQQSVSVV